MEGVQTNCLVGNCNRLRVLFQSLISSFSLSITFGMISGSEVNLHVQHSSKAPEEVEYEFHTMIGSNVAWDTVLGEDM